MSTLETSALVVRLIPYGESDRIVHLVTRDAGLVSVMVRGVRASHKRFSNLFDLCNCVRVRVVSRRKGMGRVDSGVLLDGFWPLTKSAAHLAAACHVIELLRAFSVEGQGEEELFDLAVAALRRLSERGLDRLTLRAFEIRLLGAVGLAPELRHCVRCRREAGPSRRTLYLVPQSGIVCTKCAGGSGAILPAASRRFMMRVLDAKPEEAFDPSHEGKSREALNRILPEQLEYHLGRPLRSLRYARGLPKPAELAGPDHE